MSRSTIARSRASQIDPNGTSGRHPDGLSSERGKHAVPDGCLGRFFLGEPDPFPETWGETVAAVSQVPVRDNGELLVDPRERHPLILTARNQPASAHRSTPWVREAVAEMLAAAQAALPGGCRLLIIEGYRPLETQRRLFLEACALLRKRQPRWDDRQLREAANAWVAAPDVAAPSPHTTGGAVDLTLADEYGQPMEMDGPGGWRALTAPTGCRELPVAARRNRDLLCAALSQAGLTNYPGEWWHWSFGEPGWAVRTGQRRAIYGAMQAGARWDV
jgi:D-alanyl-D-alanine dipeptidase